MSYVRSGHVVILSALASLVLLMALAAPSFAQCRAPDGGPCDADVQRGYDTDPARVRREEEAARREERARIQREGEATGAMMRELGITRGQAERLQEIERNKKK